MNGFYLSPMCWLIAAGFLVFVVVVVGSGRRQDRCFREAIDSHHSRTGRFPTMGELTRPVRRLSGSVTPVPAVAAHAARWWLLECPTCNLSAVVPGTAEEIDAAADWHNRTHHGAPTGRAGDGSGVIDQAA